MRNSILLSFPMVRFLASHNVQLPSECIGTDTSSTVAPPAVPNCSAASLTVLSTSASEVFNPKPSFKIPIFKLCIFPVS